MEVCMSLKAHALVPKTSINSKNLRTIDDSNLIRHSFCSSQIQRKQQQNQGKRLMVVEAKGKKGMQARQFQRPMPAMPKIEDDGNPRFVIFIRMANDEKEVQKTAIRQHRVLRAATEFRYGYKLVEGTNIRAALASNDVIELPTKAELKTVLDKVIDFFGDAKESFGKLTELNSTSDTESEEKATDKPKVKT
ncbi:protein HHL1, chloroplastic isoform X2 [Lactuca sativa]|uniref:protein HHL1, chloroplastic isoform X2 n=1 Tax=Lactuca sativa TaxID=4236 RepID=UPI001C689D52|nr:protein HHL1, chloroplastic isoform X2 [Lactuca sativa]